MGAVQVRRTVGLVAVWGMLLAPSGQAAAALIMTFANGDVLDGHVANSMAAFTMDGYPATLTTRAVVPNGTVNTTNGELGVNADGSGDTAASFDQGDEGWTFDWSIGTLLQGIDFDNFSTATETFTLTSADWIGLSLTPGATQITFNSLSGQFTFASGDTFDDFDLTDLSGGVPLPLTAGADLALAYVGGGSDNAQLHSLTFAADAASVPESSTWLAGLFMIPLLVRRWPSRKALPTNGLPTRVLSLRALVRNDRPPNA